MTASTRAPRLTRPKLLFAKSPKEVDALSKTALRSAERLLRKILSATGRRTVENALAPYNAFKILRDFRRSGVDRDDATRAKIKTLLDEITAIGQEFERNVREDVRSIRVKAEEIAGLPDDYLAAHPSDRDGLVAIP